MINQWKGKKYINYNTKCSKCITFANDVQCYMNMIIMENENAKKIGFVECRMAGQPYKFVLQMEYPQCLFQVLEFKDMEQFRQFCEANSKKNPFTQVGSRMVALRLSCAIQFVSITQQNASEVAKGIIETEKVAAKWYDEFLNEH